MNSNTGKVVSLVFDINSEMLNPYIESDVVPFTFKVPVPYGQPIEMDNIIAVPYPKPQCGYIRLSLDPCKSYEKDSSKPLEVFWNMVDDYLNNYIGEDALQDDSSLVYCMEHNTIMHFNYRNSRVKAEFVKSDNFIIEDFLQNPLAISAYNFKDSQVCIEDETLYTMSAANFFGLVNTVDSVDIAYDNAVLIRVEKIDEPYKNPISLNIGLDDIIGPELEEIKKICIADRLGIQTLVHNNSYYLFTVKLINRGNTKSDIFRDGIVLTERLFSNHSKMQEEVIRSFGFSAKQLPLLLTKFKTREIIYTPIQAINSFDLQSPTLPDCLKTEYKVAGEIIRVINMITFKNCVISIDKVYNVSESDLEYSMDEEEFYTLLNDLYINISDPLKYLVDEFELDKRTWFVKPNAKGEQYRAISLAKGSHPADRESYLRDIVNYENVHEPILTLDVDCLANMDTLENLVNTLYDLRMTALITCKEQDRDFMVTPVTSFEATDSMIVVPYKNLPKFIKEINQSALEAHRPIMSVDMVSGRAFVIIGLVTGTVISDDCSYIVRYSDKYYGDSGMNALVQDLKAASGLYPNLVKSVTSVKLF